MMSSKRNPAEINQDSAAHIAKELIKDLLDTDRAMPMLTRMALKTAIQPGGGVDEIAKILYSKGLYISVDQNNTEHQQWVKDGVVELEQS